MALPVKDADRRALILQKLYDVRHTQGWTRLPLEANNTQEEQIIEFDICDQLGQNGLIEFQPYYPGRLMHERPVRLNFVYKTGTSA
jgi:hypothetical protein